MSLTVSQHNALINAIEGDGLSRMDDGLWVPTSKAKDAKSTAIWHTTTQVVISLLAKGLLMPGDRGVKGDIRSVVPEMRMANSALGLE